MDRNEIYKTILHQRNYLLQRGFAEREIITKIFLTIEDLKKLLVELDEYIINGVTIKEIKNGVIYKFAGHDLETTNAEKSYIITGITDI